MAVYLQIRARSSYSLRILRVVAREDRLHEHELSAAVENAYEARARLGGNISSGGGQWRLLVILFVSGGGQKRPYPSRRPPLRWRQLSAGGLGTI